MMFSKILAWSASLCLCASGVEAAYTTTIRYTDLVNELNLRGLSVPTGTGVSVTQVEAPLTQGGSNYLPNTADSEFAGKMIADQTGGGTSSSHATTVGKNLYGSSSSMAPDIASVDVYEAGDFLNNHGWYSGTPSVESNPLQNHSWISGDTTSNATLRMDYAVERDGFLPMVGLNNGSGTTVPAIYGSIYNGISVGLSNGGHSQGGTIYDGSGRTKPEIVAPNSYTSFATPYVTAAAAMLIESAGSDTDAQRQQVLKAILLAAADKSPFADWDQTATRPIDDIYGAGQLDIYESYFIQAAGEQSAGSSIAERGWNFASLSSNGSDAYSITVPSGFELRNLSALITWNRSVLRKAQGPNINYTPTLADLSLTLTDDSNSSTLQTSDSAVDNIEHIWRDSSNALPAGNYTLSVSTDSTVNYAIAWRSQLYQDYTLWSDSAFTAATPVSERDASDDPDHDGIENLLEQAFGGDPETNDLSILPTSETINDNGSTYLQISFRKPKYQNGLSYTVQTVTNLNGTWSSDTADVELVAITSESADFDTYTYRRVQPIAAQEKAFLRVSVSQ